MKKSVWSSYHRRWSRIKPPLRPDADVVAAIAGAVADCHGRTLILGVTPEIAEAVPNLVAADRSAAMVTHIWPGDTPDRFSTVCEWTQLPFAPGSFTAAVGDGTPNGVSFPDVQGSIFAALAQVLAPGARVAIRVFSRPEAGDTLDAIRADAFDGAIGNFDSFKWRIAMALATARNDASVPVQLILDTLNANFADRQQLATATGWDIDDINVVDLYDKSRDVYSFPTLAEFVANMPDAFTNIRFIDVGSYPLAERCPLMVMETKG